MKNAQKNGRFEFVYVEIVGKFEIRKIKSFEIINILDYICKIHGNFEFILAPKLAENPKIC